MAAQVKNALIDQGALKNEDAVVTPKQAETFVPEKNLFAWKAPARSYKKKGRDFWVRLMVVVSIFAFILFLIEGVMPVILLVSLLFLFYVLSTVEPERIDYTITNRGIKMAGKRTDFQIFNRFWFAKRLNNDLLVFETTQLPGRLELVVHLKDKEKIRKTLSEYLTEEVASPSNLDRVAGWVSKKFLGA